MRKRNLKLKRSVRKLRRKVRRLVNVMVVGILVESNRRI